MPAPTAISPRAITTPMATAWGSRCATNPWMGLTRAAEASWAWMEVGFDRSKNPGLAIFCNPAKTKVPPRNNRRGSRAQPAMVVARAGGPKRAHARRHGVPSGWDGPVLARSR